MSKKPSNNKESTEQSNNQDEKHIGAVEAYQIIMQRLVNEDRIVVERTTIFLAASSILFLAFVMLSNAKLTPSFEIIRIVLPIAGIVLTAILYSANRAATNALAFWHGAQKKIEKEASEFAYMRKKRIAPHIHGYIAIRGKAELVDGQLKPIGKPRSCFINPLLRPTNYWITNVIFPLFWVLWTTSLVIASIN